MTSTTNSVTPAQPGFFLLELYTHEGAAAYGRKPNRYPIVAWSHEWIEKQRNYGNADPVIYGDSGGPMSMDDDGKVFAQRHEAILLPDGTVALWECGALFPNVDGWVKYCLSGDEGEGI